MNVYCEVKFTADRETQIFNTKTVSGKTPEWDEVFTFNYKKYTKLGQKQLQKNKNMVLHLTLFKKTMLFTSDKIGSAEINVQNTAEVGRSTQQINLINDKDEDVGKVLLYVELKEDNTKQQIQQIQNDLKMQDDSINNEVNPGMNKDMTEDRGMPLRNHEQIHLLNDGSNPLTHITHQTQSSALVIGGNFGKSPVLSSSISKSMMGVTNVSNPAVAPLYLDTTNILPSHKVNKAYAARQTEGCDQDDLSRELVYPGRERAKRRMNGEDEVIHENSSMLMGMNILGMGVVATQHVNNKYGGSDEDDYDEEDDDYEGLQIGPMIGETPPINEGGGTSSGVLNTHGNASYNRGTQNNTMAVHEVVLPVLNNNNVRYQGSMQHDDDESNVNSEDEDPEEEEQQEMQQHHQSQQMYQQMRPGTAGNQYYNKVQQQQQFQYKTSQQTQNHRIQNVPQNKQYYQSHQQQIGVKQSGNYVIQQKASANAKRASSNERSRIDNQSYVIVQGKPSRDQMYQTQFRQSKTNHGSIPKGPHTQKRQQHDKIDMKTLEVGYQQQPMPGRRSKFNNEDEIQQRHYTEGVQGMKFNGVNVDLLQDNQSSDENYQYQEMEISEGNNFAHPLDHQEKIQKNNKQSSEGGQIGSNHLEQETFSIQQQETQDQQPIISQSGNIYYPTGSGNYVQMSAQGHNYSQEMIMQQNQQQKRNIALIKQQSLGKPYDSKLQLRTGGNHSVIQHVTSHSSQNENDHNVVQHGQFTKQPSINQYQALANQPLGINQSQSLLHNYQEYEDYIQQQYQQPKTDDGSSKKGGTSSIGMSSQEMQDPLLGQMAQMNSRAMGHEYQLNQMHKSIIHQFEKIKKEKASIKNEKVKIKEAQAKLQIKHKEFETKTAQYDKQNHQLKRDKILVANEMNKVKRVYDQLEGMLYNTHAREFKEELGSVKMLLELLMNDRDIQKQEYQEDFDMEKHTAQFNESEPPKSLSERENLDMTKQYQLKLESLCGMYSKKLEELKNSQQVAGPNQEAWQNMQMMNAQLNTQMSQLTQMQQQMASQMQQVQGMVINPSDQSHGQNFTNSPVIVGSNYAQTPNEMHQQSQMLPPGGLQQQVYSQPTSMPLMSNSNSVRTVQTQDKKPTAFEAFTAGKPEQPPQKLEVLPTPMVSPQSPQKQKSSSSGEFIFNPDPNFLAKINENIRENNRTGGVQPEEQLNEQQLQNQMWLQQQDEEEYDDEDDSQESPSQHFSESQKKQQSQSPQEERKSDGSERNEMVSECISEINEPNDPTGGHQDNQPSLEVGAEYSNQDSQQMQLHDAASEEAKWQGTQGDFQNQMPVYQAIQQKLQMIGQPPQFINEQTTQNNTIKEETDDQARSSASDENEKDRDSKDEVLDLINQNFPPPTNETPEVQDDDSENYADYYNNFHDQEQSVIYEGEKLFDQPKRAKYGIKAVKEEDKKV